MRPGTDSTDSECGEHGPEAGLVAGIVITGVILALIIIAIILRKKIRGKCCINLKCIMVMLNDIDCCLDILLYCLSLYRKDLSTSEGKCYYWFDTEHNNMCEPSWQWRSY